MIALFFSVQPNPVGLQAPTCVVPMAQTHRVWHASISKLFPMFTIATLQIGALTFLCQTRFRKMPFDFTLWVR